MKHRSGWFRGKRTKWHWFDNDAEWSVCGGLRWRAEMEPKIEQRGKRCAHCVSMVMGKVSKPEWMGEK